MKSCQARDEEIRTLFLSGETLQKIGDRFGVSRERVRQILRRIGISSDEGGSHIGVVHRNAERRRRHEEKREARISETYGCTYAEFLEANEGKLAKHLGSFAQRYKSQKHSAHARGVAWRISLPEWKGMWVA